MQNPPFLLPSQTHQGLPQRGRRHAFKSPNPFDSRRSPFLSSCAATENVRPAPAQLTVPGGEPRARERLRSSALLSAHAPRSRRRAEEMGAAEADRTLFVGNLDPRVTEELVFELFHQVGDGARRPGRVSPPPPRPAAELGRGGRGRFIGGLPRARQHPCEVGRQAGWLPG